MPQGKIGRRSALLVAEFVTKSDFLMFKLLLSVFEWGSRT